jgi:hypothetical protein
VLVNNGIVHERRQNRQKSPEGIERRSVPEGIKRRSVH